ncbi:MAG TPA: heme ABC transporter permease CcmC [Caulobacteraceae bacterium]|jgi:heme exporter protein C|nr:heme ABC transporter permease CcmC [Caulobacteraceae bacterium]
MISGFANPHRFMSFSRWAAPTLALIAAALLALGLWLGLSAPPDYQQGETVRIMFVHVPAAWTAMLAYLCLGGASFASLVFRHAVADAAASAAAPLGAAFTAAALITGSLWGKPMWGTWWAWGDSRLVSVLVLFLLFVGYIALRASIEDEGKAARAAEILALVGLINLPVIKFSVDWWNTLHQGESIFRAGGPLIAPVYLIPLMLTGAGYSAAFAALWLTRTRMEVRRRRSLGLALRAAR